jgi:two-component system, NarL family, invasion response regulator UvrY
MIRVFVADDHYVVRKGLKHILSSERDIVVEGEASNADEIMQQLEKLEWDIMILDISMPGKSGLDSLIQIKNMKPDSKILMLSMHKEEEMVIRALKTGADGYLNKDSVPEELISAVREIYEGRKYIGLTLEINVFSALQNREGSLLYKELSGREFQVLCLLASGNSLKEIADVLTINIKTVSTYRSRILEKCRLKSNVELVHYALRHRLIPPM